MNDYFLWLRMRYVESMWLSTYLVWHTPFLPQDGLGGGMGLFSVSDLQGGYDELQPLVTSTSIMSNFAQGHHSRVHFHGTLDDSIVALARSVDESYHYCFRHRNDEGSEGETLYGVRFSPSLSSLELFELSGHGTKHQRVGVGVRQQTLGAVFLGWQGGAFAAHGLVNNRTATGILDSRRRGHRFRTEMSGKNDL